MNMWTSTYDMYNNMQCLTKYEELYSLGNTIWLCTTNYRGTLFLQLACKKST